MEKQTRKKLILLLLSIVFLLFIVPHISNAIVQFLLILPFFILIFFIQKKYFDLIINEEKINIARKELWNIHFETTLSPDRRNELINSYNRYIHLRYMLSENICNFLLQYRILLTTNQYENVNLIAKEVKSRAPSSI